MDFPRQPGQRSPPEMGAGRPASNSCCVCPHRFIDSHSDRRQSVRFRSQIPSDLRSPINVYTVGHYFHSKSSLYYQQTEWNSSDLQCARVRDRGFSASPCKFRSSNGAPATYPSIYVGCHWGRCTDPAFSHLPIEESHLATAITSVDTDETTGHDSFDVAYDIFFNQTPTASGQPDGTGVMIWINHSGFPDLSAMSARCGLMAPTGRCIQVPKQLGTWFPISATLAYRLCRNLDLKPFFVDAVARGSLKPSWYLIDVEMGFEVWTGGQGLAIRNYSVSTTAQ